MYVNFLVLIIGDHVNDANILGRSVHTVKKNAEALVIASKEIGLEVNADKTKYMVISRDQNAGQNHDIKIDICCGKCGTVQIFGNNLNISKFYSGRK
jgi:hypothetical protein